MKHSLTLLAILGILVALFGIGVDYLLPGTSPGFNLPQLLIAGAGLTLSFAALQLRRETFRRRISAARSKSIFAAAIITLLTLLALEIVLTVSGMPTYFPREIARVEAKPVSWWACDELGCRYQYDAVTAACLSGEISGRNCVANRQGFASGVDFVVDEDFSQRVRILIMGDSFSQGFTADIGKILC